MTEDESYEDGQDHIMSLANLAGAETLKAYWQRGKGAAKIRWGMPGDYMRCVRHIDKYVTNEQAHRICAQWHHDVLGKWPGQEGKKK
jgi:hypothetical protein